MSHKIIYIFLIMSSFISCEFKIENEPPDAPIWIQKSAPEDSIETGIDAEPLENRILLEWHPVVNKDLEGYKIYRAIKTNDPEEEIVFEEITSINIYHNPEFDSLYFDEDVVVLTRYLYYIKSFDYDQHLSESSDTLQYQLTEKADLVSPVEGEYISTIPDFKWFNKAQINEVVIRVETYPEGHTVWISRFSSTNYTGEVNIKKYNFDGSALKSQLTPGSKYRWRIDSIYMVNPDNTEWAGSESVWQYFTVSQ